MKRLIWLPIAGFLLIAGATVAAAAPSLLGSAPAVISPASGTSGTSIVSDSDAAHPGQDLLAQVLRDLVSQDVITQDQSDAITQALQDKVGQQRADAEARRALIQGFIEDGVITQDEIDQLPADDPLRVAFDSIADDGQITLDQLRGLGPGFGPGHHGRGPGGPWFGPGPGYSDPDASPNPSTTSSNS